MDNIKAINLENTYKKPHFNKKSVVWTDTTGANISYKIKMVWFDIKHFFQRGIYGYCRTDVWDFNYWFLDIVPKMLGDLIEGHVGFPGTKDIQTDEAWVEILSEMKHYLEEATEKTCSEKNEFEDAFMINSVEKHDGDRTYFDLEVDNEEAWENYKKREIEIGKYQKEMLKKGLKLFTKYFQYLWD